MGSEVAQGGPPKLFGAVGVGVTLCAKLGATIARTAARLNFMMIKRGRLVDSICCRDSSAELVNSRVLYSSVRSTAKVFERKFR